MAVVYAIVRPWIGLRLVAIGIWAALLIWLLNSAVVLPAIGEGFAGSRHLELAGMAMFATFHTAFFVLLALWDQMLRSAMNWPGRSF